MVPRWRIKLLGGLSAACGDLIIEHFETRKVAALLACLALSPGRTHSRDGLAEYLWPDEDWDAIRNRLRQALFSLRRALEPPGTAEGSVLITSRTEVWLSADFVSTDLQEFLQYIAAADLAEPPLIRAEKLECALNVYGGELAPLTDEGPIPDERRRIAEIHHGALCELAEIRAEAGNALEAITACRKAVALDPLREDTQCLLMRLYSTTGRRAEAIRQYRELESLLRDELGASPSPVTQSLIAEIVQDDIAGPDVFAVAQSRQTSTITFEPEGGAVRLDSPFYVERPVDALFHSAIARGDSIVLVKGARHIGKTSLLARGIQKARSSGLSIVHTDIQKFAPEQLESAEMLFAAFADMMVDQLDLDLGPEEIWNPRRGWNVNFERFLRREVLGRTESRLMWGIDEVDRLFGRPYADVVFGIFRSWHNERSLNPEGPWSKLTLALAYATEAHLFITDLNQSPFNVGTRLTLEDFARRELDLLNGRYGNPLKSEKEMSRFTALLDGHPFLVRRGLQYLASQASTIAELEAQADRDTGIFGDHLRRLGANITRDKELESCVRALLQGEQCPTANGFFRLRSAGVLSGETVSEARLRCGLYQRYLEKRLL